jgi:glycosyltransferase involved in cell wall biosynthesis
MNVLHVSTPHTWRGGEQQAAYLMTALHEKGITQCLLCPQDAPLRERVMIPDLHHYSFTSRGVLDIRIARRIRSIIKEQRIDIIHCHDSHAHSAAVIAASIFKVTVPIIVSRRVDFPVSSNPLSRWKYNHPSVKKIICVSKAIADITAPSIRDNSKLAVVHSGIDVSLFQPSTDKTLLRHELGLPTKTILIGNLSALADHKDHPTFLRTTALLLKEDPTLHFIIAGEGPEENKIRQIITDLQIEKNVHMLGFRKDIRSVMQSLDVFLITSRAEGLGTIVLDAFASGIPVIATRAGGIPEMVEDGITGLLADVGDAVGLSKAVLHLLAHPELKSKLISNASSRVQDFSFKATAGKTLEIYHDVILNSK